MLALGRHGSTHALQLFSSSTLQLCHPNQHESFFLIVRPLGCACLSYLFLCLSGAFSLIRSMLVILKRFVRPSFPGRPPCWWYLLVQLLEWMHAQGTRFNWTFPPDRLPSPRSSFELQPGDYFTGLVLTSSLSLMTLPLTHSVLLAARPSALHYGGSVSALVVIVSASVVFTRANSAFHSNSDHDTATFRFSNCGHFTSNHIHSPTTSSTLVPRTGELIILVVKLYTNADVSKNNSAVSWQTNTEQTNESGPSHPFPFVMMFHLSFKLQHLSNRSTAIRHRITLPYAHIIQILPQTDTTNARNGRNSRHSTKATDPSQHPCPSTSEPTPSASHHANSHATLSRWDLHFPSFQQR